MFCFVKEGCVEVELTTSSPSQHINESHPLGVLDMGYSCKNLCAHAETFSAVGNQTIYKRQESVDE